MRLIISILMFLFLWLCVNSLVFSQDSTFVITEAFRIRQLEDNVFLGIGTFDLDNNGIQDIVLGNFDPQTQQHQITISESNELKVIGPSFYGTIWGFFTADFNLDGIKDLLYSASEWHLFGYFAPDFNLNLNEVQYFGDTHVRGGGDRILENGETVPVFYISGSADGLTNEERPRLERWSFGQIWQGTWENDHPIEIGQICLPTSFSLLELDGNSNYFSAGVNRHRLDPGRIDTAYFQLFTNYQREFDQPDSLTLFKRGNSVDLYDTLQFCQKLDICDLENDGRLEWLQPYWTQWTADTFMVHLLVIDPIDMNIIRVFRHQFTDINWSRNSAPNPVLGVSTLDINDDGILEILLAVQSLPIMIIDSQTLRIVTRSEFIIPDVQTTSYEFGKFDESGRLQIILRDGEEHVVYNLPDGWQEPNAVLEDSHANPIKFGLNSAFPNPFNSTLSIEYSIPRLGQTKLSVYNVSGREVAVLVDEQMEAGYHQINWNATDLPSGLYFARLQNGGSVTNKRLVLIK